MDPFTAGALISGGANLIGGLFSQSSARSAYQHRYQDTVKDMKRAGLNPALAYGQNPGGGAQTHDFGDIGEAAMKGGTAKAAAAQAIAQRDLTVAQTNLLNAQAQDIARRTKAEADTAEHGTTSAAAKARQDTATANIAVLLNKQRAATFDADVKADLARSLQAQYSAELTRLGLEPAKVAEAFAKTFVGRNKPTIDMIESWLRTLISGAAAARGIQGLSPQPPREIPGFRP